MRFVQKQPLALSVQRRREEADLSAGVAFGFTRAGGALRGDIGVRRLPLPALPAGVRAEAAFFGGGKCAVYSGGQMYVQGEEGFSLSSVAFSRLPVHASVYDGEDALLLSDGQKCALLSSSGLAEEEEIPAFAAAAYFGDRLWLASGIRLTYGAPDDIRDFSQAHGAGGYIDAPSPMGEIVALAAGSDGLFVFRERGLQLLAGRGEERGFSLRDLLSCAPVYGATAACDGERAFWLAQDGLHVYGGDQPASAPLFAGAAQASPRGSVYCGRYLLQADVRAECGTRSVLAVFGEEEECVLPLAAEGLCGSAFCAGGEVFSLSAGGGGVRRSWESGVSVPFGDRCTLEQVRIRAKGNIELRAKSDEGERIFRISCDGRVRPLRAALAGREFSFLVRADTPAEVGALEAFYERGKTV